MLQSDHTVQILGSGIQLGSKSVMYKFFVILSSVLMGSSFFLGDLPQSSVYHAFNQELCGCSSLTDGEL